MKKTLLFALSAVVLLAVLLPAAAQVQENLDLGALIGGTNTYNTAVTTNSAAQTNTTNKGVLCQFHQLSSSGTATTTFAVQSQDAASGVWTQLAISASITSATDAALIVYPTPTGISGQPALPTGPGANATAWVAQNVHLPRTWRVQQVIGGTGGPAWNVSIGCNYLN
jgi:hypothetical protein